ncbi:hypothetical protein QR98_0029750 [Sarcoptes scabiei]|uniref:Uncharacterized protein n=1 Tax=Sarcoptes scabiei TaxID=52283 RepID=A0A132A1S2_SARSC|nr:hypothetical protein QR98_0029750 [Sarcoptes scabiei]
MIGPLLVADCLSLKSMKKMIPLMLRQMLLLLLLLSLSSMM